MIFVLPFSVFNSVGEISHENVKQQHLSLADFSYIW